MIMLSAIVVQSFLLFILFQYSNAGAGDNNATRTVINKIKTVPNGSWEYTGELGPINWYKWFPDCGGYSQSPININPRQVVYDASMEDFNVEQYSTCDGCTMEMENLDGHTLEVVYDGNPIIISGGSLPTNYHLTQFHFHWGGNDSVGSEHMLDDQHFPMELHVVHEQIGLVNGTAKAHPFGLAVLGFLVEIGQDDNAGIEELVKYFPKVTHRGNHTEVEHFSLSSILPANLTKYYRYYGSLTTPPCYESVIWTIFGETIKISKRQLELFRGLKTVHAGEEVEVSISNDYRPIQPLHQRRIYANDINLISDFAAALIKQLMNQPCQRSSNHVPPLYASASLLTLAVWLFLTSWVSDRI